MIREFFDDCVGPVLVIIIIVVMTWRICHNVKDPNCSTDWEAMTCWTCPADADDFVPEPECPCCEDCP